MYEGDIFYIPLPDGRFGAVRVLRANGVFEPFPEPFHMLAVTEYIDTEPPAPDDPRLRRILHEKRLSYDGKACIGFYCGELPASCGHAGNLPLLPSERHYDFFCGDGTDGGYPICGRIPSDIGCNVLDEWRWEHDREAFLAERERLQAEAAEKAKREKPAKPKNLMDDESFWEVISLLNLAAEDDDPIEQAATYLARKKVADIRAFSEKLALTLYQIDTRAHAMHIGESAYNPNAAFFSVDTFLYARCAAVANGKAFYDAVLADPSQMPKNTEFESLLYLSAIAYERRTGREYDHIPVMEYETFANEDGWKE